MTPRTRPPNPPAPSRRALLGAVAGLSLPTACATRPARPPTPRTPTAPPGPSLDEATIDEIGAWLRAGKLSARELCAHYLARIDSLDRHGPALGSILEVNPDALAISDALDHELRERGPRGPLHGVSIVVKANLATADHMGTSAGSLALAGSRAPFDATVIRRLREAGAVLVAKTNLSEWANFRSAHASSGWSAQGGQCKNPYALDRSPCGSSSGTGAAVAANLAAAGVGTETDGSIVCPSAANALVGLKPTLGLVSRRGIVPIAHSQDTAGPMARTVRDAALLLDAIAGPDPHDAATADAPGGGGYARRLDPRALAGTRLGIVRAKMKGISPATDALFDRAIGALRELGAVVVDPVVVPHAGEYDDAERTVLLYEFKADLDAYLAEFAPDAPVHTLADVVRFNERNRARELAYFGQETFVEALAVGPLTDAKYRDALARCRRLAREEGLDAAFARDRLDALVAPTGGPPWPIDLVTGDHFLFGWSTPAAVAGYPSVTVPIGEIFGLPIGLSFVGKRFGDGPLLSYAYAYERATRHRRPPTFAEHAALTPG